MIYQHKGALVALTGRRNVGKSTAAAELESRGFVRVHAFDGGKVAAVAYFEHILAGIEGGKAAARQHAFRMVYGDLKDKPCEYLPGNAHPREFLERFGKFMGIDMGVEWTLKTEIERTRRIYGAEVNIVADSMVYESDYWREQGGKIVRLARPEFDGQPSVQSDSHQAKIAANKDVFATSADDAVKGVIDFVEETFFS